MENILEVKKLKISFRTNGGAVKAVRDISFNLEKGKTLAIVGESGSGKSVTSKAILGILAGNSIVEGGEILFDGKDLLRISEDEMYKIRGDKIAMIFQDPLSSLNPIVKIGQQITEAMLLKNKANRRQGRLDFNTQLKRLNAVMNAATNGSRTAKIDEMTGLFDRFCIESNKLENAYNQDAGVAQELVASIEDFLFKISKHQKLDVHANVSEFAGRLQKVKNEYLVYGFEERLATVSEHLKETRGDKPQGDDLIAETTKKALEETEELLRSIVACPKPNFFRIGYYVIKHPGADAHVVRVFAGDVHHYPCRRHSTPSFSKISWISWATTLMDLPTVSMDTLATSSYMGRRPAMVCRAVSRFLNSGRVDTSPTRSTACSAVTCRYTTKPLFFRISRFSSRNTMPPPHDTSMGPL